MPRIHLAISFDHELSLGGVTTSYDDDLFAPTLRILELADLLEVPITLFTDVLCGIRFRDWESEGITTGFSEIYEAQLQEAVRRGHDVQLHLHPHWLDSSFESGKFRPSQRYSLHDFRFQQSPNDIPGIVERSIRYLERICRAASPGYDCVAFRAGGLNIAPSTDLILKALMEQGIRIDSSVARGYRFKSRINSVDYSRVPETANWFVSPGAPINEQCSFETGCTLFEVPIVSVPRNPINNLPALGARLFRLPRRAPSTGLPLYDLDSGVLDKFKRLFPFSSWMLSFDLHWASGRLLVGMLERYASYYGDSEEIWAASLSHPKSMGPGGIRVMGEFLAEARKRFNGELEFCDFQTIAQSLDTPS